MRKSKCKSKDNVRRVAGVRQGWSSSPQQSLILAVRLLRFYYDIILNHTTSLQDLLRIDIFGTTNLEVNIAQFCFIFQIRHHLQNIHWTRLLLIQLIDIRRYFLRIRTQFYHRLLLGH